jgi:hypothetical protein
VTCTFPNRVHHAVYWKRNDGTGFSGPEYFALASLSTGFQFFPSVEIRVVWHCSSRSLNDSLRENEGEAGRMFLDMAPCLKSSAISVAGVCHPCTRFSSRSCKASSARQTHRLQKINPELLQALPTSH